MIQLIKKKRHSPIFLAGYMDYFRLEDTNKRRTENK